jgi:3-hydroxybutyryl-CoA dehydrogenase
VGPPAPVELPAGALLWRCDGTPATALAARWGAPVVVVDRCLDDTTATAVALSASDGCPEEAAAEAVGLLQAAGLDVHVVDDIPGLVVTRTVAMLVNLAVDAAGRGVASAGDIDAAMRLGTAYPLGPLAWGDRWGAATVAATLTNLAAVYGDARYRPAPWLARAAATGAPLTGIPWPHRQAAGPAPPAAGVGPAGTPRPAGGEPAGANQEEAAP